MSWKILVITKTKMNCGVGTNPVWRILRRKYVEKLVQTKRNNGLPQKYCKRWMTDESTKTVVVMQKGDGSINNLREKYRDNAEKLKLNSTISSVVKLNS